MSDWRLAPSAKWLDAQTLVGGAPYRVMKLSERGAAAVRSVVDGRTVDRPDEVALLDRLSVAGILLRPTPTISASIDVTIVIPALSAAEPVRRLVASTPPGVPVIVVDDGSAEPLAGQIGARARVVRHDRPHGPAAARNAGAALANTTWIVFVDADVEPADGWIAALLSHAEDGVVAIAPRILSTPAGGVAGWFETHAGGLDQGAAPGDVAPTHPISYVPSAALAVRADALAAAGGFDEELRVGEDVDLVWRLGNLGRIRYEPAVIVQHRARPSLVRALSRRRTYGTSAAALAARHPGRLHHVDVSIWSFAPWLLSVVSPVAGVLTALGGIAVAPLGLRTLKPAHARRLAFDGHLRAVTSLGRWLVRPMLPVTLALAAVVPSARWRLAVLAGIGLIANARKRAVSSGPTGIASALAASVLDDLAYTTGVWQGVLRVRNLEPLLPRVRRTGGKS